MQYEAGRGGRDSTGSSELLTGKIKFHLEYS